jgi:phasin family protein
MARKSEGESLADMFSAFGRDLKIPGVDVDAVVEHQRKNLEALQKAMSAGASGASAVLARQREMLQQQMDEIGELARNYASGDNPRDAMSKHADAVRRSFETAVKNAGEVAQIVQKSGAESVDILRQRIRDSMEEIRDTLRKDK